MKTLCIAAQKGGTGKTTSTLAIAAGLARRGNRVLLVDLDGQTDATRSMGLSDPIKSIADVLQGSDPAGAIVHTAWGVDLIPSTAAMYTIDQVLPFTTDRIQVLKKVLQPVRNQYDFCVFDTPPALSLPTLIGLYAADQVVIPLSADDNGLACLKQLQITIDSIRQAGNRKLKVSGIILTMHNKRSRLSQDYIPDIQEQAAAMGTVVYQARIRRCEQLRQAQDMRMDIFTFDSRSNAAEDYNGVIDEILTRI